MIGCSLAFGRTSLFFGRDVMMQAAGLLPGRSLTTRGIDLRSEEYDYDLFDDRGKLLGTINAARVPPIIAKNAPTFFLRMKRHVTCGYANRSEK
jgi:hypothetical protein